MSQKTASGASPGRYTGAMQVSVNGEPRELVPDTTLAGLLEALGLGTRRLAIALNAATVPRGEYAARTLREGDRVEIIEAVGGG